MLRDFIIVTGCAEIAGLSVLDLERDTTGTASNDRFAFMKGLRNLDFETLTS